LQSSFSKSLFDLSDSGCRRVGRRLKWPNSRDTACTRHPGSYSGADNRSRCAIRRRRDLDRADRSRLAPYSPAGSRSQFASHCRSHSHTAADHIQAALTTAVLPMAAAPIRPAVKTILVPTCIAKLPALHRAA
jgi:hypothetical protein